MTLLTETVPTETVTARLAGRGRRLGAVVIDGVIGLTGSALSGLFLAAGLRTLADWTPPLWLLLTTGVQIWLLALRGQTVGKALLKIAIVDPESKLPPGFLRSSVIRQGPHAILLQVFPKAFLVFFVSDSLFIFTPSRRCIHDRLARTEVIEVGRDWR